jgi:NAD(P)-dependent dehydrogenase (short-subunit alcohol dehydrogenase family)
VDLGLAGAAVCVQGGSKGMGRAAAECFAADGARVAVMARGREALDDTVARLTELGSPDAVGLEVAASDATSIANGFAELGERWGELNSLVCAVGPQVSQLPWDQVSDDQFVDAYVIGALSAVRSARAALPLLRAAKWARIVNLAAMSARSQGFGLIEYTAAKAALVSITKNLSSSSPMPSASASTGADSLTRSALARHAPTTSGQGRHGAARGIRGLATTPATSLTHRGLVTADCLRRRDGLRCVPGP